MIEITSNLRLNEAELEYVFICSPGPGGQNVNKLATAVQLRFNVVHSVSLPEPVRLRLLGLLGKKITNEGDFIIKASRFRTQERNKQDALNRLLALIKSVAIPPKKRRKTKPTAASVKRRLRTKKAHGVKKSLRRNGMKDA